jgi:hypothetical protein
VRQQQNPVGEAPDLRGDYSNKVDYVGETMLE